MENKKLTDVLYKYVKMYIKVTKVEFSLLLSSSPTFPSLLSIYRTLNSVGVEAEVAKVEENRLSTLSLPFLLHIGNDKKGELLLIIKRKNDSSLYWDSHANRYRWLDNKELLANWSGVVLLTQQLQRNRSWKSYLLFFLAFLFSLIFLLTGSVLARIIVLDILALTLLGHLFFKKYDLSFSLFEQVCKWSEQDNCTIVSESSFSSFFSVPINQLGFSFFLSKLVLIFTWIVGLVNQEQLMGWNYYMLSFIGVPMIIYSVCTQFYLSKWCILCLLTNSILVAELSFFFFNQTPFYSSYNLLFGTITLFLLSFCMLHLISQYLDLKMRYHNTIRDYMELKRDDKVLNALINPCSKLSFDTTHAYLQLGDKNATVTVTLWLTPFCKYCEEVVKELCSLKEKKKRSIQWHIYLGTTSKGEVNHVKLCFIEAYLNNPDHFIDILKEWYINHSHVHLKKYANQISVKANDLYEKQRHFSKTEGIESSPVVYINSYRLPKYYALQDLKNMIDDGYMKHFSSCQ
ncbi:MAG: vitamin K epoxide reductase family protein [Phocaeicola sp.]